MAFELALLARGARTVVEVCAGVRPGEQVLVVADAGMDRIAQAVAAAVFAAGAEPAIATITPRRG